MDLAGAVARCPVAILVIALRSAPGPEGTGPDHTGLDRTDSLRSRPTDHNT